jgi:hypothetical protein
MSKDRSGENFGVVWGYVVPCRGCSARMIVPNKLTDVCPPCQEFPDYDDYPIGEVQG